MKEKETGVNIVADGKFGTPLVVVVEKVIFVDALFGFNHAPKTGILHSILHSKYYEVHSRLS
jgi:hypothetical protein